MENTRKKMEERMRSHRFIGQKGTRQREISRFPTFERLPSSFLLFEHALREKWRWNVLEMAQNGNLKWTRPKTYVALIKGFEGHEEVSQSLRTPMLFNGWLIDWVNVACTFFPFLCRKPSWILSSFLFHTKHDHYAHRWVGNWPNLVGFFPGSIDF